MTIRLKKGDNVQVIAGKDKGKTGKLVKVMRDAGRVVIEDVNVYTKHLRPTTQGAKGQTVQVARSLAISNVNIICKSCNKPVRIGHKVEGDTKTRICKSCEAEL